MEKGEADSEKEKEEKQEESPLDHLLAKGHMLALSPQGGSDHQNRNEHQEIDINGGAGAHGSPKDLVMLRSI